MTARRLPGFTLLELLLAAAVFAVVASYAGILLASTAHLGLAQRQNQALSIQGKAVFDAIGAVATPAGPNASLSLFSYSVAPTHGYGQNSALVAMAPRQGAAAAPVAFCVQTKGTTKRLVRITFNTLTSVPSNGTVITNQCLNTTSTDVTADYLTDESTDVLSFKVTPVWTLSEAPANNTTALLNPPALHIDLVLGYAALEQRKNGSGLSSARTVLSTTVERIPGLNFSTL